MAVTMAEIQNLRKKTGAGMMDCKNALTEANGDIEKAIEIIRKKGQAFAAKRGDRDASEGCVLGDIKNDFAAIVAIKCETDFVAMNAEFIDLTRTVLDAALEHRPKDMEALKEIEINGRKVADLVTDKMGITGEKMELGAYEYLTGKTVVAYIHPGNKLSSIVGFNQEGVDPQIARDIAMQVAAMNPVALTAADVTEKIKETEKEIARDKARQAGKPENILDRIAEGALEKFYKEFTLVQQDFIKNQKITVGQYLEQNNKGLLATGFKRVTLNEE